MHATNSYLLAMREKVKEISDETFDEYKKGVATQIADKDKTLKEQAGRFWNEIATHNYNFKK